jgi:hypothetical protein
LRLAENSFENAHFAFVHRGTFGDNAQPKPSKYEIEEIDYGFVATTIDDGRIQLVQLPYRNDTEDQCPTQALIDWDAAVVYDDRDILEATDPDVALDLPHRTEAT